MNEHQKMVRDLVRPARELVADNEEHMEVTFGVLHMLIGLQGELGEVTELMKKVFFSGRRIPDVTHRIVEELGDVEFYLEGLRQALCVTREEILEKNVEKLRARFPDGKYNTAHAEAKLDLLGEEE